MRDLTVTLVQADTRWHDAPGNREMYAALLRTAAPGTDLYVLPETFLSGFSNEAIHAAEGMDGEGVRWMAAQARDLGAVIAGSLVIREQDRVYNRLVWARPDGSLAYYDKRHLFRMAGEHERYAGGSERLIVELNGWRVCPLVCYDLRFPVWMRNRYDRDGGRFDYDLLLFVANWPSARRHPWRTLLRARAMENWSYVVGVNRVGIDGNQLHYAGDSAAIDYVGESLLELGPQPQVAQVRLSASALAAHRERFPAWMDADAFELRG